MIGFIFLPAQTVLLEREEDGKMDSVFSNIFEKGEDDWMSISISGIAFPVSQSNAGAEIEVGPSLQLTTGSASLYQFNNVYALGFGYTYNFYNYRLIQEPGKILPNPYSENDKETFRLNCLQVGPAMRFTLTPNREKRQYFLDLGADVVWVMGSNHRTWNENEDGSLVKIKTRKLQYTEPFQYLAYARIGLGMFSFYGSYRFSDVFKPEYGYPELPNINIGFQLTIK